MRSATSLLALARACSPTSRSTGWASSPERRSIAADRRQYAIYLTAAGREAAERAIALQHQLIGATLGKLAPEKLAAFETLLVATRDLVRADRDREAAATI